MSVAEFDRSLGSANPFATTVSLPTPIPVTDGTAIAAVAVPATNRPALATTLMNLIRRTVDPSPLETF